jgi:NTP pyrophosphatase (non-canonical NTP hydrolase)
MIDFDGYQEASKRTIPKDMSREDRIAMCLIGAATEACENLERWKKHKYQGHALFENTIVEEVGDQLFYLANLLTELGVPMHLVAEHNITKLKRRYPEGFTTEASLARADKKRELTCEDVGCRCVEGKTP